MAEHELKTWPEFFDAIWNGEKTFEVREEDDRHFEVGDTLLLREYDNVTNDYSGRWLTVTVTYILRGSNTYIGACALQPGYAVMGFKPGVAGARFDEQWEESGT